MTKLGAYLGLGPAESDRMQPSEMWEYAEGEQLRWNRTVLLVGWAVFMVVAHIPRFSKGHPLDRIRSLDQFVLWAQPPGYKPPPDERKPLSEVDKGTNG